MGNLCCWKYFKWFFGFCKQMLSWDIMQKKVNSKMRNFDSSFFILHPFLDMTCRKFTSNLLLLPLQEKLPQHEKPIKSFLYLFTQSKTKKKEWKSHVLTKLNQIKMKNLSSSKSTLHIKLNYMKNRADIKAYRTKQNIILSSHDQIKRQKEFINSTKR